MEQIAAWSDGSVGSGHLAVAEMIHDASPLGPGAMAPKFSLPDADMGTFSLADALAEQIVVLHFYPRNAMPSSIKQAISFSDHDKAFSDLGVRLVAVSLDDCLNHADFRDEHGIAMELLSDPEGEVCRLYGVWQERQQDGVIRPAVHRSTFIIGTDGIVLSADYNVDVRDHTEKLLALLRSIVQGRKNGNRQERRSDA